MRQLPTSVLIAQVLRGAGDLFLAREIVVEKGRIATATGSLASYIRALVGSEIPAQNETMIWFASEIGPMVRFHSESQTWGVVYAKLQSWLNHAEEEKAQKYLVMLVDAERDRVRALLFLLLCFSETAGEYAGPIVLSAQEEGLELPYVVRAQLVAEAIVGQHLATAPPPPRTSQVGCMPTDIRA